MTTTGRRAELLRELGAHRLFAELDAAALEDLAALSRLLELPRKRTIYSVGEAYRGMFIVLSGLAVVYKLSTEGRMLILHVCRPGDTFAEVPLFEESDAGYPDHARTTRDSRILHLPKAAFAEFIRRHPSVAWSMLQGLAAGLKEMSLQLEGVTLREVSSRLARYLLREMEAADGNPELTLPLTKGSIASYLGTVHETLSRTFSRLIREQVIAVDGPRITILDEKKLRRLV